MTTPPRNELEQLIAAMHAGEIDPEAFAHRLIDHHIFLPVKDDKRNIGGFQSSTRAEPLVVEDDDGQRILIAFSAPEHAKAFVANYPGYGGGLITELSWILRRMGENVGIALNPGEELGVDLDPEMVAMLLALLPDEEH